MKKVLIVEDDSFISRMFERAFKLGGYEVELASDGQVALNDLMAAEALPSAILMDVMMPNMDGATLLQAIKKEKKLNSIPVVVLTNSYLQETADKFIAMGADLYLVKMEHPSKEIIQKVDELIAKHEARTK